MYGQDARPVLPPQASAETYHPASGTWKATGAMDDCAPATSCRSRMLHAATLLDPSFCHSPTPPADYPCGQVLVAGGAEVVARGATVADPPTAEIYDPEAGTWQATDSMADACDIHQIQDCAPQGASTATLLDGPQCSVVNPPAYCGQVLVAGGFYDVSIGAVYLDQSRITELYNPRTKHWSMTGSLNEARSLAGATLLGDGRVLVAGGMFTGAALDSAEVYDPGTGVWTLTAPMGVARSSLSTTLLDTGECGTNCKVLAVGGVIAFSSNGGFSTYSSAVEEYDPQAGTWTTLASLHDARGGHSASLLADGRVLVVGAGMAFEIHGGDFHASSSAELFDPAAGGGSGAWTYAGSPNIARGIHSAGVLDTPACHQSEHPAPSYCGRVMIYAGAGLGNPNQPPPVGPAEIYVPAPRVNSVTPAGGPSSGGTRVVITGSGLGLTSAVRFGDQPATGVMVDSPTQVSAIAPAHPKGAVDVSVSAEGGVSATTTADGSQPTFTYAVSRPPGAIADLAAKATSASGIELSFSAPSSDGPLPPPAGVYVVKQSKSPIDDDAGFGAARTICKCSFVPGGVGDNLKVSVSGLSPSSTYYYAVEAVNEIGMVGPSSNRASATTAAGPPAGDSQPVATPMTDDVVDNGATDSPATTQAPATSTSPSPTPTSPVPTKASPLTPTTTAPAKPAPTTTAAHPSVRPGPAQTARTPSAGSSVAAPRLVTSAPKAPTVHPSTTTVPDEGDTAVLQASPARSGEHDSGLPLWLIVVLALGASSLLSVVGFRLNARLR